jgi:hypothetical protein
MDKQDKRGGYVLTKILIWAWLISAGICVVDVGRVAYTGHSGMHNIVKRVCRPENLTVLLLLVSDII